MSGKNLLNENTIRRFMKLANVEGLTDSFVNETGYVAKSRAANEEDDTVTEQEELPPEDELEPEAEEAELEFGDDVMADEPMGADWILGKVVGEQSHGGCV